MALTFSNGIYLSNVYLAGGVADAPLNISAAALSSSTASVSFSAPSRIGDSTITSYSVISNPGNITATTATAGTVIVSGLTSGVNYSFSVYAVNSYGNSVNAISNSTSTFTVPGVPTIGTVTSVGTTATVAFTAPASNGGITITSYTATSSPGGITGTVNQSGSGSITVSGLTLGQSYTFTVHATNSLGNSPESSASTSITITAAPSSISYTTAGTYSWVAPAGVTSVSVVAVGGGGGSYSGSTGSVGARNGGGGGGLGYKNNYPVTAGTPYTVVVGAGGTNTLYCTSSAGPSITKTYTSQPGGPSYFVNNTTVLGGGGTSGGYRTYCSPSIGYPKAICYPGLSGGSHVGDGGGNGGSSGAGYSTYSYPTNTSGVAYDGGGGGAGGYSGNGGNGSTPPTTSNAGTGGGGGGGMGGNCGYYGNNPAGAPWTIGGNQVVHGGGVGLFGQGSNGTGNGSGYGGGGAGSGGCGINYGGGGGYTQPGGSGAVRIVWPGNTRQFPSTCVGTP